MWQAWPGLPGLGAKVVFATVIGLLAAFSVNGPYWNWYQFSPAFVGGQALDYGLGFALAGVVLAKLMRK